MLAVREVLHTDSCERYDVENRSKEEQELMICAILFDPRYKDGHLLPFFLKKTINWACCVVTKDAWSHVKEIPGRQSHRSCQ